MVLAIVFYRDKSEDAEFYIILVMVLTILNLYSLIKRTLKYFSLKKNGQIINNVPYEIMNDGFEKKMIVNYTNNYGKNIKLYKLQELGFNHKIMKQLPQSGITSILINPNNEKQYFIFYPNNTL